MKRLLLTSLCLLFASAPALADWDTGDPFKMHFPQLPGPYGWAVNFVEPEVLADEWRCTQSGPVSDIHFWCSSRADGPFDLLNIHVSIHSDDITGPFSQPGDLLWEADFQPPLFTVSQHVWTGWEGWYDPDPVVLIVEPDDHFWLYQVNIVDISDPFIQEEGTVYWLDLSVFGLGPTGPAQLGWKTSPDHFRDDAVWTDLGSAAGWQPLYDPFTGGTLDLAFVIAPEPGTIGLLAMGGLMLIRRKRA